MMCLDTNIKLFEVFLKYFVWSLDPSSTINWMKKSHAIMDEKPLKWMKI